MKNKILIFRGRGNIPNNILSKILKKWYDVDNIIVNRKNFLKTLFYIMKKRKTYDKVIIISGPVSYAWFFSKLISKKSEFILFVNDFNFFWKPNEFKQKILHKIRLFFEKQLLLRADKIIHKGLENELEFLPFYDKIKNKPHYLFREFLDKDLIQEYDPNIKLSKKDGKIHLVYGGGWRYKNTQECISFFELYKPLSKLNVVIHIYTPIKNKKENEMWKKFLNKNKKIILHKPLPHEKLIKEYSKYDYGINFYGISKYDSLFKLTAFSNKTFDYIAAGLPIITNLEFPLLTNLVKNNNLGVVINLKNINKNSIPNTNTKKYKSYVKNVLNFRKQSIKYDKIKKFIIK